MMIYFGELLVMTLLGSVASLFFNLFLIYFLVLFYF